MGLRGYCTFNISLPSGQNSHSLSTPFTIVLSDSRFLFILWLYFLVFWIRIWEMFLLFSFCIFQMLLVCGQNPFSFSTVIDFYHNPAVIMLIGYNFGILFKLIHTYSTKILQWQRKILQKWHTLSFMFLFLISIKLFLPSHTFIVDRLWIPCLIELIIVTIYYIRKHTKLCFYLNARHE